MAYASPARTPRPVRAIQQDVWQKRLVAYDGEDRAERTTPIQAPVVAVMMLSLAYGRQAHHRKEN